MRFGIFAALFLTVGVLVLSAPLSAHHGTSGYDMDKDTVLKGTITEFDWTNPHGEVHFDAVDTNSGVQGWIVECGPPSRLVEIGWTRHSLAAGDHVTLYFHAAKNGSPRGILVKVVLENGTALENRA
jgi:hypothetical protein